MDGSTLPPWLVLIGALVAIVSGIGGLITGAKGLAVAKRADAKASSLKVLDLRLELRKAISELRSSLNYAKGFLHQVNRDRLQLASVNNLFGSGSMVQWSKEFGNDFLGLDYLTTKIPKEYDHRDLDEAQLEERIVEVHKIQGQINFFKSKYEDEEKRTDFLRQKFADAKKEDAADRRLAKQMAPPPWSAQSFLDQNPS